MPRTPAELFEEIVAATVDQDIGAGGWALAHLAIGDTDRALQSLEQGAAKHRIVCSVPGIRATWRNHSVVLDPMFVGFVESCPKFRQP